MRTVTLAGVAYALPEPNELGYGVSLVSLLSNLVAAIPYSTYIATETGAANALAAALLDQGGNAVPLAAGLRVQIKSAHSLQAGANTLALNGGAATAIKKHTNPANSIGTAYVNGSIVDLMYDGAVWQDMAQ
ncbi:MAG: hypothetical protein ACYC9X_00695 [Dehalococcoidia bacterium]